MRSAIENSILKIALFLKETGQAIQLSDQRDEQIKSTIKILH